MAKIDDLKNIVVDLKTNIDVAIDLIKSGNDNQLQPIIDDLTATNNKLKEAISTNSPSSSSSSNSVSSSSSSNSMTV